MTYNELVAFLQSYTEDVDTEAVEAFPLIIGRAEAEVADLLKGDHITLTYDGLTFDSGERFVNKPDGIARTISLFSINQSNKITNLKKRTFEFCADYDRSHTILTGPKYYSDYNFETYYLTPGSSTTIYLKVRGLFKITGLSSTNPTTLISNNYPQLLQTFALKEYAVWSKNNEMYQIYQAEAARTFKGLEREVHTRFDFQYLGNERDELYSVNAA